MIKGMLALYLLMAAITGPWYLYTEVRIQSGLDRRISPIDYQGITDRKTGSEGMVERAVSAVNRVTDKIGFAPLLLALVLLGLIDSSARVIFLLCGLPVFLLWLLFLSYYFRNLGTALPFFGLMMGSGIVWATEQVGKVSSRIIRTVAGPFYRRAIPVLILVVAVLAMLSYRFPEQTIVEHQVSRQMHICKPIINRQLYSFNEQVSFRGKVLGQYQLMNYLPGFEGMLVFDHYNNLDIFLKKEPNAAYLLVPKNATPRILAHLDRQIAAGIYKPVLRASGEVLLERVKPLMPTASPHEVD